MKKVILFLALVVFITVVFLVVKLFKKDSVFLAPSEVLDTQIPNLDYKPSEAIPETVPSRGSESDKKSEEVKEFIISARNFSFEPNVINVKKGDRVKIVFRNVQGFHDFRIDAYGVATKQFNSPGEEILEFTAEEAGTFEYYCSVNSHKSMGMAGALKVE